MYFDVTTHARADSVSSPFGMMRMGDGVTLMTDITYNAVVESSFQLLKRERIKRQIYLTRDEARADVFDYIEMFYNPKRRHSNNDQLSPIEYERRYLLRNGTV